MVFGKQKIFLKQMFQNVPRFVTLLRMNPYLFTFKGILYRVKTWSCDPKTFRSSYFPETFLMTATGSGL